MTLSASHVTIPEIDLLDPQFKADPYPTYTQLREHVPVCPIVTFSGEKGWLITRYDDVKSLVSEPTFSTDRRHFMTTEAIAALGESLEMYLTTQYGLLGIDDPRHAQLRSLVHKTFTTQSIARLRPRIQEIVDTLLDTIETKHEIEFIQEFAFPLPVTVICELLGIPMNDREQFREWARILEEGLVRSNNTKLVEGQQPQSATGFIDYLDDLFRQKHNRPGDDLVSTLVQLEAEGGKLSKDELYAMVMLLIVAGHETTVNLLSNTVLALLQFPDQLKKLQQHPALVSSAVEEGLRYGAPVEFASGRWAKEARQLHGVTIQQGDTILLSLAAANRDPHQFENPEQFDIARQPNRHLGFGHGMHFCIGAPLARLETQIALATLIRRLPTMQLATSPQNLSVRPGPLRGLNELPLAL